MTIFFILKILQKIFIQSILHMLDIRVINLYLLFENNIDLKILVEWQWFCENFLLKIFGFVQNRRILPYMILAV